MKNMRLNPIWVLLQLCFWQAPSLAQGTSCNDLLQPQRTWRDTRVGPDTCQMQETDVTFEDRKLRRVDMGLSGTVEGYLAKTGNRINYFNSAPELLFPQAGNPGPIHPGIGRYEMSKGSSMTLLYPMDRPTWNGKLWVTVHGGGASFKHGTLRAWDQNLDPTDPMTDISGFERLMLKKGFAVAKTRRSSYNAGGDVEVALEDGTRYAEKNVTDNAQLILDFARVAQKTLQRRVSQTPTHTYLYGHSAGGRIGRIVNYVPGLNKGPDGKPIVNGLLPDDSGAGLWLPIVFKNGKDVLFATQADRAAFVPQLEVSHQLYNRESIIFQGDFPDWVSGNYLLNKRRNAQILADKGLGDSFRIYEVRGISHATGENQDWQINSENLNLVLLYDRLIDILDAWVTKGTTPPPTRSDWAQLGDLDRDGVIENPAIEFPEVACPIGVYYQKTVGAGSTSIALFTGEGELEPLDENGVFVDMNRNGVWDVRETPTQVWRRMGLIGKNEVINLENYAACVYDSAQQLRQDGFFSQETARWYSDNVKTVNLRPEPEELSAGSLPER